MFSSVSYYFDLYNLVQSENLPIKYIRDKTVEINVFGYFRYNNNLTLNGYTPVFDEKDNACYVEEEHENYILIEDMIEHNIIKCNA